MVEAFLYVIDGRCDRWKDSFEHFLSDMGERPSKLYTLDRVETNGNYEPSNCRWATHKEQCNNMRSNIVITYRDVTLTAMQWAIKLGIKPATIYYRVAHQWPTDKILSTNNPNFNIVSIEDK